MIKGKFAIRWVIWGIRFIAGLVIWGTFIAGLVVWETPPFANPPNPHRRKMHPSQRRVNGAWESFDALRLGGTTVEAPLCCDETDSARGIHALLDTASNDDQLD